MDKFKNCVAVVTGAGSGIGQQLAYKLSESGAKLAISDIDANGLAVTEEKLRSMDADFIASIVDVSQRDAVFSHAEEAANKFGKVNLVVNNAGVALTSGTLQQTSIEDFEWLMSINFSGVLYGTKAYLPILEKSDWGHIVNISSIFGIIGVPEQGPYNASKFAVRGMTEALRQELEQSNSHISCTSVHPGGIKTGIARNARTSQNTSEDHLKLAAEFENKAMTTAESAAQKILSAVEKNKRRLIIGKDAKLLDWAQRHFPNHYQKLYNYLLNKIMND